VRPVVTAGGVLANSDPMDAPVFRNCVYVYMHAHTRTRKIDYKGNTAIMALSRNNLSAALLMLVIVAAAGGTYVCTCMMNYIRDVV
jgi:hypothetical protein